MNLFDLPDDGRRSLEQLRAKLAEIEREIDLLDAAGEPIPASLYQAESEAVTALAKAEREALK